MTEFIVVIGSAVTVLGTVATAFLTFRTTRTDVSSKTIEAYKAQVDLMEKQQREMQGTIRELTVKVAELTGVVKEKNDRILSLESILQGRNPEMESFMGTMLSAMQGIQNFIQRVNERLTDVHPLANE